MCNFTAVATQTIIFNLLAQLQYCSISYKYDLHRRMCLYAEIKIQFPFCHSQKKSFHTLHFIRPESYRVAPTRILEEKAGYEARLLAHTIKGEYPWIFITLEGRWMQYAVLPLFDIWIFENIDDRKVGGILNSSPAVFYLYINNEWSLLGRQVDRGTLGTFSWNSKTVSPNY